MAAKRRLMTVEEVLAVLRAGDEPELVGYDERDSRSLALDQPASRIVDSWTPEGTFTWRGAADSLNARFQVSASHAVWGTLLRRRAGATVGDVCAFLSSIALVPEVSDELVLGRRCRAAGAFMTIRDLLVEAGEPVDRLAPATLLSDLRPTSVLELMGNLYRCSPALVVRFGPQPTVNDGRLLMGAAIGMMGSLISFPFLFETRSILALAVFLAFATLLIRCCYRSWSYFAAPESLRVDRSASLKDIARARAATPK